MNDYKIKHRYIRKDGSIGGFITGFNKAADAKEQARRVNESSHWTGVTATYLGKKNKK